MYTSCVGSFPVEFCRESVERIAKDLYSIGLTYPSYPQLRDFVSMFLDPLSSKGFLCKNGLDYVFSANSVEELEGVEIPVPFEALWFVEYVRKHGLNFAGLRAPVTGVFTLASRIYLTGRRHSIKESLINDLTFLESLSLAISRLIRKLEDLGYSLIVVDEPILSIVYGRSASLIKHESEDVLRIFERLKPRKSTLGIHVCGRISPALFRLLLKSNFTLLDHEFKDSPENFESLKPEEFKESDKLLSVGCASSRNARVENVKEVLSILSKALNIYGDRVYMAKPDCGFRGLSGILPGDEPYKVSIMKLKTIVEAVKKLN
jgi:5-methyltetrahydropteroyltriglutamate--homocysteine methyltransferase